MVVAGAAAVYFLIFSPKMRLLPSLLEGTWLNLLFCASCRFAIFCDFVSTLLLLLLLRLWRLL